MLRGFFISCAIFLATFSHASCLSLAIIYFVEFLSLSIIKLKFLFNFSNSLSVLISGTFEFKLPFPILFDAEIRLLIETKKS